MSRHDFQVGGRKEMFQKGCVWYIQIASYMIGFCLVPVLWVSCVSDLLDFDLLMVSSVMWLSEGIDCCSCGFKALDK